MFAQIEPVDEFLAFRSCFLLLDLQAPLCLAHGGPAHPSTPNIPRSGSRPRPSLSQPTSLRPPPPPQLLQRQLEKAAEVLAYLEANRELVAEFTAAQLPGIRHFRPEATYLAWLDCRELGLEPSPYEFFLSRAKVALSDGAAFGRPGRGFVRLNFATSRQILSEALGRMAKALRGRSA